MTNPQLSEADSSTPPAPTKLVFDIPEAAAPGFLRRQRDAIRYREALRNEPELQDMDNMIDFLLTFVAEPADRAAARELLLDLSRMEYMQLFGAITRESPDFLPQSQPSA